MLGRTQRRAVAIGGSRLRPALAARGIATERNARSRALAVLPRTTRSGRR